MSKGLLCLIASLAIVMVPPSLALAQEGGGGEGGEHGGGGGGAGCGDVFGDLVHILRADTGQPILAQRWIEMPKGEPGYGWGYCPIPVDAITGNELGFLPLTCDPDPGTGTPVEVDYFGRLSGGRTKEKNHRMHFNEVISNIKMAGSVGLDETGRLLLGYDCTSLDACADWGVIDSPMENMALYTRLMKYGHFQTWVDEVDMWPHGDPATQPQYNPALDELDWAKFQPLVRFLLPGNGESFCDSSVCAEPESLSYEDFVTAAAALGGAANKTGKITVDLVQYMNRILKITKNTEASLSNAVTVPALVRDCWSSEEDPVLVEVPEGEPPIDPIYDATCTLVEPDEMLPNYGLFPDVQEMFVDFSEALYDRAAWRNTFVTIIGPLPADDKTILRPWVEVDDVSILDWLAFENGPQGEALAGLTGFVAAGSDTLRSIEFVHNYAVPEDLDWDFVPSSIDAKFKLKAN